MPETEAEEGNCRCTASPHLHGGRRQQPPGLARAACGREGLFRPRETLDHHWAAQIMETGTTKALHNGGAVLNKKRPPIVFGIALHILQRVSITRGTTAPA